MSVTRRPVVESTAATCGLCDRGPTPLCPSCPKRPAHERRAVPVHMPRDGAASEWDAVLNTVMLAEVKRQRGVQDGSLRAAIIERRRLAAQCRQMWGHLSDAQPYRLTAEQVDIMAGMADRLLAILRAPA